MEEVHAGFDLGNVCGVERKARMQRKRSYAKSQAPFLMEGVCNSTGSRITGGNAVIQPAQQH